MLPLFAIAIFMAAALLFVVQPMVARMVLPVLGGSPAVWNTAMVFFQAALLAGYLYAHLLTRRLGAKGQVIVHGVVLLLPLAALPIALPHWTPPATKFPVLWALLIFAVTVGLPFTVVATTGPLLQRWFSRTSHRSGQDPYFLYAASNVGSLLALLGYPFLFEPALGLRLQSVAWSIGYGVFALLAISCGVVMLRRPAPVESVTTSAEEVPDQAADKPVTWRRRVTWVALAFVPSSLMLGVTQHISTDIAAVPLLWVIPLSIYLLTFIIAFSATWRPGLGSSVKLFPVIACALAVAFLIQAREPAILLIVMHLVVLFLGAMLCHTRLADDRPDVSHVTEFYLLVALGGVLGGAFNAILAPLIFTQLLEYPIAIALVGLMMPPRAKQGQGLVPPKLDHALDLIVPAALALFLYLGAAALGSATHGLIGQLVMIGLPVLVVYLTSRRPIRFSLSLGAVLVLAELMPGMDARIVLRQRTFFGYYRVVEEPGSAEEPRRFRLLHGTTSHGVQLDDPRRADTPTSYYTEDGPVGDVMRFLQDRRPTHRGAIVGLGIGSLAAYARKGDHLTYYEIDPAVREIAENERFFTFIPHAIARGAEIDYEIGDARLTLSRSPDDAFDFIVVDAFSSDAIPIHLLTTEAIELYFRKIRENGVLVLHISNRHLDLEPVVQAIAHRLGLKAIVRADNTEPEINPLARSASTWVVLARQGTDLTALRRMRGAAARGWWRPLEARPGLRAWTDDHADVMSVFIWEWPGSMTDILGHGETDVPDGG